MSQVVYEKLPAYTVDLDKVVVTTFDAYVEPGNYDLDKFKKFGVVNLLDTDKGIETKLHWGKTHPDIHGISLVLLIDAPEIKLEYLQALWIYGVIEGDYPSCPN